MAMSTQRPARWPMFKTITFICLCLLVLLWERQNVSEAPRPSYDSPSLSRQAQRSLAKCRNLKRKPGPAPDFHERTVSNRFEAGTPSTLIKNATIFTGGRNGTEVVYGDLFLSEGIVKGLGYIPPESYEDILPENLHMFDAHGAWVTPGLVDFHSHMGILSFPLLGPFELNSAHGPTVPFLRSIDALNTHDEAFHLALTGGVTSAHILPGSGNAMGGESFMIKTRKPADRSSTSMIVEPWEELLGESPSNSTNQRPWRYLKQTIGENLDGYGTRMDGAWHFRRAYDIAKAMKEAQDAFCQQLEDGLANEGKPFPESLETELLVQVLRGSVNVNTHAYEATDIDAMLRISQEFGFHVAAFHHAAEAYLLPDRLKEGFGGPPAVALFGTSYRYKREAYRGSEFAPRILANHGIPVIMKTDHPVIKERNLLTQAQQAHYFGLPAHLALASVTSVPATVAGMEHRIGILREGADADVVVWDRHPLRVGATPLRVWVDGKLEINSSNETAHMGVEIEVMSPPRTPNWDYEREATIAEHGLPPLGGSSFDAVTFINVREVMRPTTSGIETITKNGYMNISVTSGRITCISGLANHHCPGDGTKIVDLSGGSILPGLSTYGSPLGLEEINYEQSTGDGQPMDPFLTPIPAILGDPAGLVRASDGLIGGTRNSLIAHRSGVTTATSTVLVDDEILGRSAFLPGLSVTFRTGSTSTSDNTTFIKKITALHITVGREGVYNRLFSAETQFPSVSTQIATLRRLLFLGSEWRNTETEIWFHEAAVGGVPLVIHVSSSDIMATLIRLKYEVEERYGSDMKMIFAHASEAHLIADDLARAKVGVILTDPEPSPFTWSDRRATQLAPGETVISTLLSHGVTVALGTGDAWNVRNAYMDIARMEQLSRGKVSREQAIQLASTNMLKLLDVDMIAQDADLVAFEGGSIFDLEGKPKAVLSPSKQRTEVF